MTTVKMSKIDLSKLVINMKQKHNKQDLRTYAEKTLLQNITTETSSSAKILYIQKLIDYALTFSGGNFLFLETIIKYWKNTLIKSTQSQFLKVYKISMQRLLQNGLKISIWISSSHF